MTRVKLSALILALALGTSVGAAASDHDRSARQSFERHERHEQFRNHDRDRWAREHHNDQRRDWERERRQREAMHRWDREHHRRPMTVKRQEPRHDGWDRGRKTGWHGNPAPHGRYERHEYAKHPKRRVGPGNQQVMNRPPHDLRTAPVAR